MNLVTGATGIVGSHVVLALLQNNQPVVACRRKHSDLARVENLFSYYTPDHKQLFEKITWVEVDILDIFSIEEALEGISTVYHCAGFVSFSGADKNKLFAVNEKGTRNVVDACLAKQVQALCHVSSIAAINNLDYTAPLNEEVFWKKSGRESDYAISKYNAEREVWRGIEEGLNAVIVNPGVILSPGFWNQSSSRLFASCYKSCRFYTNGFTGYVAAPDVAKAMLMLIKEKKYASRYILVEGNYTFRQIFTWIREGFHKPAPTMHAAPWLLKLLGRIDRTIAFFSGKPASISKAIVQAAYTTQQFSALKIEKEFGFKWMPVKGAIAFICKQYLKDLPAR